MTPAPDAVSLDADHRALAATLAGACPPAPADPHAAALQRALLVRRLSDPRLSGRALLAAVADEHPVASHRLQRWLTGARTTPAQVVALPVRLPAQQPARRAS